MSTAFLPEWMKPVAQWSLDDIPWSAFDASRVTPELVSLIKAASLVEHNGHDYARYLCQVFADDAEFQQVAREWGVEEVRHGEALARWSEMADRSFDFTRAFAAFTAGYQLPQQVVSSVRGSKTGELIARCVVETGTSSYYTAIAESTDEPVIRNICLKIAADEFRHYKLFYGYLKRYLERERIGAWKRLRIALGRIAESEDDELAYAFYAAHRNDESVPYDHATFKNLYLKYAYAVYRRPHLSRMTPMVFKAAGLSPQSLLARAFTALAWRIMQYRRYRVRHRAMPASMQPLAIAVPLSSAA